MLEGKDLEIAVNTIRDGCITPEHTRIIVRPKVIHMSLVVFPPANKELVQLVPIKFMDSGLLKNYVSRAI